MLRHSPYLRLSFRSVLLPPSPGLLPAVPLCSYRPNGFRPPLRRRFCRPAAVDEKLPPYDGKAEISDDLIDDQSAEKDAGNGGLKKDEFPSGDLEFRPFGLWRGFVVKLRMLFAFPWERVRKGSVLSMKLRGPISDQLQGRFSSRLSVPQICENLIKAAYDPRISGIFLQIEPLQCGWGKIEEIRRHIIGFKKSGKFIVSYVPVCQEKEYYLASACGELYVPPSAYIGLYGLKVEASFLRGVFEKIGIEPQIQRIGKYKSAGDTFSCKNLSEENREMLTRLLDNIYENWLKTISSTRGKDRDEIENFLNEGIYEVQQLKDGGWITDINYEDEVMKRLKERLQQKGEKLLTFDYKKYSKVRKWTLGLTGGKDQIAIIRASGSISRVRGPLSVGGSGIIAEQFIEKIRSVRESKKYKAAVIRIDSPGGDALASDLMWREIRLLGESMPVVASMSDVAASGGYYMAMAAGVIVAEDLTLTGSIGVVTGKFNLGDLYERIGFNKEVISRGKFAELNVEQRSFRPDEAELFAKSAQRAYKLFRDKAAFSRSMSVDEMEEVAQGRVWTGSDAVSHGLVDAIGGVSRAIAIARMKEKMPPDREVKLVEVSKPSSSLLEILSSTSDALVGVDSTVRDLWQGLSSYEGVKARMDGIMIEGLDGVPNISPIFTMIKDYLSSL